MAQAVNTAAVLFAAGNAGDDTTHVGLWTALTGGTFLGAQAITADTAALQAGERFRLPASAVVITFPEGDFRPAMAVRGVNGIIAGTLYLSLHSADPGTTGANQIAGTARQAIALADWTVSE